MGLIDFVVNAGKKLFGADSAEAARSPDPDVQSKRSSALENEIKTLGLNVEGLKIKVADQTVHVRGKVNTQADKEKVVLALGNVDGIAKVDDSGLDVATAGGAARMAAIALAFVSPWLAYVIYALIAVMWIVPDRRIAARVTS